MPDAAALGALEESPTRTPTARTAPESPPGASRRTLAELAKKRSRKYGQPLAGEQLLARAPARAEGPQLSQQPAEGTAGEMVSDSSRREAAAMLPGVPHALSVLELFDFSL